MFTGIIEEKGKINKIIKGRVETVQIEAKLKSRKGDSIAVQGICLTVADLYKNGFSVQAMRQTKRLTTLSDWRIGNYVNLESALKIGDRLGGHIILGHIDEVGKVIRIKGNEYYFQVSSKNSKYLISKGSIGVDGVSLTISSVSRNIFSVNLIPFTLETTALGELKPGAYVNIEFDYLIKLLSVRP